MVEQAVETLSPVRRQLCADSVLVEQPLWLQACAYPLRLRSNSSTLLERLRHYFAAVLSAPTDSAFIDLTAIDCPPRQTDFEFTDWSREAGKSGRKDSYCELPGGRLIRKLRTGMLFLQCQQQPLALGPCLEHDNQLINFINSQWMNRLQQRGALIAHAAAVCRGHRGLAIAGLSGGGKSTLMLHLLEHDAIQFVSNDRLFIEASASGPEMIGIPKQPRINPGTLLHNPRLKTLLSAERQQQLRSLPARDLWQLEEKHDVLLSEHYGSGRLRESSALSAILILNWAADARQALSIKAVDFDQRPDLLPALMKSPGPFYQDEQGRFLADGTPLEPARYLQRLRGLPVWEASGRVDFAALSHFCITKLLT